MTAVLPNRTGPADEDWRYSARCAQEDPDLFFPDKFQPALEAKAICAMCRVVAECRADALSLPTNQDRHGVRGGLTATEREKLRKAGP